MNQPTDKKVTPPRQRYVFENRDMSDPPISEEDYLEGPPPPPDNNDDED